MAAARRSCWPATGSAITGHSPRRSCSTRGSPATASPRELTLGGQALEGMPPLRHLAASSLDGARQSEAWGPAAGTRFVARVRGGEAFRPWASARARVWRDIFVTCAWGGGRCTRREQSQVHAARESRGSLSGLPPWRVGFAAVKRKNFVQTPSHNTGHGTGAHWKNFTTKLPRTTLGTGLARQCCAKEEFYNLFARHWARDWRALALTQVHHGSRLSDSCHLRGRRGT